MSKLYRLKKSLKSQQPPKPQAGDKRKLDVAERSDAQKAADTKYQAKQKKARNYSRIRWCWRVNAEAGHDATDEQREEEAQSLKTKLEPYCGAYVFQLERGEQVSEAHPHGYYHFQGYLELKNKNRKDFILKNIEAFNYCEPSRGSAKSGWDYGSKQATRIRGPWSLGEPTVEGQRTDINDFKNAIKEGKSASELWESFPGCMARYPDMPLRVCEANHIKPPDSRPVRMVELQVIVLYGKAGSGKSYAVRQRFPNIYVLPFAQKVWLTPEACEAKEILVEDFDGNMHLKQFNRMLDPYPEQIERKHGHLWYMPDVVVITTNLKPSHWFNYDTRQDVKEQVYRRITAIFDFNTLEGRNLWTAISPEALEAHDGNYPLIPAPVRPHPKFTKSSNCFIVVKPVDAVLPPMVLNGYVKPVDVTWCPTGAPIIITNTPKQSTECCISCEESHPDNDGIDWSNDNRLQTCIEIKCACQCHKSNDV